MDQQTSNANVTAEEQKEAAHIVFEEHAEFKSNADVKYLSSVSFAQDVSTVMHGVYADFEGCKLQTMKDGSCYFHFYFNHNSYPDTDKIVACTPQAPNVSAKNQTLYNIRLADSYRNNGEKYYLTEDGKSTIADLLIPGDFVFDRNTRKVKWNKVVVDVADPNPNMRLYINSLQMLTQVSYIDPCRIAALMYGDGSEETGIPQWEYVVRAHNSLMPNRGFVQSGVMLSIERISVEETNRLARELGIQQAPGLDIIR